MLWRIGQVLKYLRDADPPRLFLSLELVRTQGPKCLCLRVNLNIKFKMSYKYGKV